MARTKGKVKRREPLRIHSLVLTSETEEMLRRLRQDTTDYTARKVSGSAVLRALLRFANAQGYDWTLASLCPLIEAEILSGIQWGKKK
jgi:hypothetical protein